MGAKLCFLPYLFDKTFRQNGNNKCIVNFRAFCLFFFKPNGVFILLVVFLFFACQFLKTCPHPHFQCRFEAYSTTPTFRWASKAPPTFRATSEACPLSLSKLPHFPVHFYASECNEQSDMLNNSMIGEPISSSQTFSLLFI